MTVPAKRSAAEPVLGRERELGQLAELLTAARAGHGGGIVVSGEPGIGKTELLRTVADRASGTTLLMTTGLESEATLSFAALGDILRPLLNQLDRLPTAQAAALRAALALDDGTVSLGQYAVCMGTLNLLSAAGEQGPILVVVDDAQWIDGESRAALLFVARRLADDPVVIVFATRDEAVRDIDTSGLISMRLGGFDRETSDAYVASIRPEPMAAAVGAELYEATSGNPLALREIGSHLTAEQLDAQRPLPDPLPVGRHTRRMFAARLEPLPATTRLAMLVLALSASSATERLAAPLWMLQLELSALDPAESAGLIVADQRDIRFAHPLIRSVVTTDATSSARRAAYLALAECAADDEAVLYRAAGASGPDDALASELEQAAGRMRDRLGFVAAARALHRAAELTADPQHRARRLLAAALVAQVAGRFAETTRWLDDARELADDASLVAEVELARGRALTVRGTPSIAAQVLIGAADAVQHADPRRAARLLCEAALPIFTEGRIADSAELCARAVALADAVGSPADKSRSRLVLGQALTLAGATKHAGALLAELRPYTEGLNPVDDGLVLSMLGAAHSWLENPVDARQVLDRVVQASRSAGALGLLAVALSHRCETNRHVGEWAQARADGEESLRLAREIHQPMTIGFVQVLLAYLDAAQGNGLQARRRLDEARLMSGPLGTPGLMVWEHGALALLALADGQPDKVIDYLEPVREFVDRHGVGNPNVVLWEPDLIEAYWRAGRPDEAAERLTAFAARADATQLPTVLAAVSRCRGLLAPDPAAADAHFRQALVLHKERNRPFEHARTALCCGETMRRQRRSVESRAALRDALHTFQRLGAEPFAQRAVAELAATGEPAIVGAGGDVSIQGLSPQELQVALGVARGLSNPAIAAALFLSRKTVEAHLSRVYRKLPVASRTQLVAYLAANGFTPGASADDR